MKVQVKNLQPNPYRDIKHYPYDKFKIESLKHSIEQTGFWDNILARDVSGVIQIAYGHHRLEALKQVLKPTDYIDIPVKKLDDSTMIQIMANENMDQWKSNPEVIIETVKVTRTFLNSELKKYKTWEDACHGGKFTTVIFSSNSQFQQCKQINSDTGKMLGAGRDIICKFLGENWTQSMVKSALDTLDATEINRTAVAGFDNLYQGDEFKRAVKDLKKAGVNIPLKDQPKLAEKVQARIKETKRKGIYKKAGANPIRTIVRQEVEGTDDYEAAIKDIILEIESIAAKAKSFSGTINSFNGRMASMEIDNLKSLDCMVLINELGNVFTSVKSLSKYLNFEFNDLKE